MAERNLSVRRHAINASAIAKWWLNDEDFVPQALALKVEFEAGRAELATPTHLHYEVTSLLRRAVRSGRISQPDAEAAIATLFSYNIHLMDAQEILAAALTLSLRLNLSLYDACYLIVADAVDGTLISDDRNMRRALGGSHPRINWLEDYQP
jgi:predicted nucleic acid-binding protein